MSCRRQRATDPAAEMARMMKAREVIRAAAGKLKWWEAEIMGARELPALISNYPVDIPGQNDYDKPLNRGPCKSL